MRYDIMFAVKNHGRKITVMDFKLGRKMVTLEIPTELESEEVDDELREVILKNMDKINSGYYDYSGSHKNKKPTSN